MYGATADPALLRAARLTADGALSALGADGFLAGRLEERWRGTVPWACLTGTVQFACCWFMLYRITGKAAYRAAAVRANAFVRRTISVTGPDGIRGGVRGSFPVDGSYCQYQFPSSGAKCFVDSHLLELENPGALSA